MSDYIKQIRKMVGHEPIILTFAAGILVNKQNEILLQKRSDFNQWGLPGGAMEYGENAEKTCQREFLEETGYQVKVDKLLGISTNQVQKYPNGDLSQSVVIFFVVTSDLKDRNHDISPETMDLCFFNMNKLPKIFNKQHYKAIQHFKDDKFSYFD
ncbi:NUDIX hydrolase [Xylocopilactobacillus apis]|uniref:NUDIX domain-containing protein n=1 Tax=Xylocopilactobacillus apis TaxID=2932183 RepID=A0AAU9DBV2_9LACO|nr:NUDIX hydrolase [Xylocopilactobacillus apis]BDR57240.1 NUDIX domain-containing protein [Xylocopilactobacillus apis]